MEAIESVKLLRKSLGETQAEFAARFGLAHQTYAQWERGRRRPDQVSELWLRTIAAYPALAAKIALNGADTY